MAEEFRLIPLNQLCLTISSGGTPSRREPRFWTNGTIPWIKTGELNDWKIHTIEERITEAGLNGSAAKLFAPGTILMAMYGDGRTITTMGIVDTPAATNQACCGIVANPNICDPLYLFYALKHERHKLLNLVVAGAQRNLSVGTIRNFPVPIPSLGTQRRIASIQGAYDDLIDVNRRRVAVLEEMARGLFEEWFIRFRYPGHEAAPILDAPDGSLPESWTSGVAADLIAFDPKTTVPRDGLKPFISMGHLDTATSLIAPPEQRAGNSGTKFRNGDTLFARITPCLENGKTGLVRGLPGQGGIGFGSTEYIVMRGEAAGPAFTYCLARHSSFRANARNSMSGATGRQRARTASLASFAMPVPPLDLLRRFDEAVWPMLELVGNLGTANETLASARDLLLPRLISGQLSVAEAERELEQAA
ncbi:restriction endonuclease subunit S [Rhizobium ruizarguesonis]|uniref:restriction endonuclease subunit S n=1 Tax=Rhizobium ruizarguesonis TaxID=2081791 RepID=UPI0013EE5DEA|nr:restriction endonuclease subunit S [Rhizobium ruizarguesonis]